MLITPRYQYDSSTRIIMNFLLNRLFINRKFHFLFYKTQIIKLEVREFAYINYKPKNMLSNALQVFNDPDMIILAIDYNNSDEYSLEFGKDFIYDSDDMTDAEIIDWAIDSGYLEEDEEYIDQNGNPDVLSLRELKRSNEMDNPTTYASPSGRAFLFFEELDIPHNININIIDGPSPGNDWQGVIVKGINSLIQLQQYFIDNGSKINFIIE